MSEKNNKKNVNIAFGMVFLSLVFGAGLIPITGKLFPDFNSTDISLFMMFVSTLLIAVPVLIYLKINNLPFKERLRAHGVSINILIAILFISIGIIVIIDELDRIVYAIFGSPDYLEEIFEQLKITSIKKGVFVILSTVVAAPLVEEMLFRGYLQKVLEDNWEDITKAILVTSLTFALIHLNPYWVVQIYLLGLVLGYLAWRTNSIIPGIILHGLNNGFAVALNNSEDIISQYYNWHEHVHPVWIVFAIIFIIVGFKKLNNNLEIQS